MIFLLKLLDNLYVISSLFYTVHTTSLWIYTAFLSLPMNNYLSRLVHVLVGWSFQGMDILLNWRSPTKGFQSSIHHSQMCISLRKGEKTLSLMYREINVSDNYGPKFSVNLKCYFGKLW